MKKILANQQKYEHRRPNLTEMKCQGRINDVLKQNQHLRRELLNFRVNESFYKKRTSNAKDRNSIFIEKNIIELQKLQQKKMDLEEENVSLGNKIKQLQQKVIQLAKRNEELETIHYKHTQLYQSVE